MDGVGRLTWSQVDADRGRPLDGDGGLTWSARWSGVDAERGVKWTQNGRPTMDGHLTAKWATTGQPCWPPIVGRRLGAHYWATSGRPYHPWRWTQLEARKLGAHTRWTQKG